VRWEDLSKNNDKPRYSKRDFIPRRVHKTTMILTNEETQLSLILRIRQKLSIDKTDKWNSIVFLYEAHYHTKVSFISDNKFQKY
jgi:hypothetical protein